MFVRRATGAIGAVGIAALLAATMPTAYAGDDDDDKDKDKDKVRVTVCKYVDDDDDRDHRYGGRGDDDEFDIELWTDEDDDDTTLGDRDCESFKLKYDDNKLWVKEDVDKNDWDVDFKVWGDVDDYKEKKTKVKIKFDDDEDRPHVKVLIINEED